MIVRIMGEGQYRVPSALLDQLNDIDNQVVTCVAGNDEAGFRQSFTQMLDLVRSNGEELSEEDLHPSDVVLPIPDIALNDARAVFAEEGLIPD